jgi:hypothetical protein
LPRPGKEAPEAEIRFIFDPEPLHDNGKGEARNPEYQVGGPPGLEQQDAGRCGQRRQEEADVAHDAVDSEGLSPFRHHPPGDE